MAGLLVAVFWAILVSFLAVALVRLAQTLRAATKLVSGVTEQAVPLLGEASATVRSAQTQLDRVDAIASDVQEVTANASALSTTVGLRLRWPAGEGRRFGYGVRRALRRSGGQSSAPRKVVVSPSLPAARRGGAPARKGLTVVFRRAFWFSTGAAAGVWATTKVHRKLRSLAPDSMAAPRPPMPPWKAATA